MHAAEDSLISNSVKRQMNDHTCKFCQFLIKHNLNSNFEVSLVDCLEEIRSSQYVLIFKTQLFKRTNTRQTNSLIETRKDPERVQQSAGRERKQSLQCIIF